MGEPGGDCATRGLAVDGGGSDGESAAGEGDGTVASCVGTAVAVGTAIGAGDRSGITCAVHPHIESRTATTAWLTLGADRVALPILACAR